MKTKNYFCLLFMAVFLASTLSAFAQNIKFDSFESYTDTDDMLTQWRAFGYSTLSLELVNDSLTAPSGGQYIVYNYSGNDQTTWGGAVEMTSLAESPMDLSDANSGLQFYFKGDGTDNVGYVRLTGLNDHLWESYRFSFSDTSWQLIRIPFEADSSNGFWLDGSTTDGLLEDLTSVTDLRFYVSNPVIDNIERQVAFDEFYAMKFWPPDPEESYTLDDFESFVDTDDWLTAYQAFGYSTIDYALKNQPSQAPEGAKYLSYTYRGDDNTTWGGSIRTRSFSADLSSYEAGIQFYFKGDGTENQMYFRLVSGSEKWASYYISLADTNWHRVTIPFIADSINGFRYLGNGDDPVFGTDIGTTAQLYQDLAAISEFRWIIEPEIDYINYTVGFDGIYAVNEFPPLEPIVVDNFESYTNTDDLKLTWNLFGTAAADFNLTTDGDYVKEGSQAALITYNGSSGTSAAIRMRNILPTLDFSAYEGGIEFWLKGDGSTNKVIFRFFNGSEMWASNGFPLSDSSSWTHYAVPFKVDTVNGFRYLGNNTDNPTWSSNIGTDDQLIGDLSNIDQIRFEVRDVVSEDYAYTFAIDDIEAVDEISSNVTPVTGIRDNGDDVLPYESELSQNYPNPFNPTTNIQYRINNSGPVTLKVFNILGQEVMTLVNSVQKAGSYQVNFNASKLASGVYIYQIRSNDFVSSKKMMLLK